MAFIAVWNKYLPAVRILLKKAATTEQVIGMNRSDFDRAAGTKKTGYRFSVNFIKDKPDAFFSGNDLVQAFIAALVDDAAIRTMLAESNYTFSFNSKYQLQIKNAGFEKQALLPEPVAEETEN